MATRLKNLKVKKVDFVDEGANPDAHIKLFKSKDYVEQPVKKSNQKGARVLKRLFSFIGKAVGVDEEEIDTAIEEIIKGNSEGFTDKLNEFRNRKIADEIWDTCYALQNSLCSILNDGELDSSAMANAMQESLNEFHIVVQECIPQWSTCKESGIVKKKEEVSETDLEIMKLAVERLNDSIEKAAARKEEFKRDYENLEGEREMKIDKSKLTDAEKSFLESIEKRCGIEDRDSPSEGDIQTIATITPNFAEQITTESTITKSVVQPQAGIMKQEDEMDNIYKGLHPAVRMELKELKKFREATEERELTEVAKRYAIIGKKEEELIPLLKSLKAAGGTAYHDMIAVLDQVVDTVEKSGVFSEIGKSGHGGILEGSAWAEADKKAVELMKSKTGLTKAQALDEVLLGNPELAARCEKEE